MPESDADRDTSDENKEAGRDRVKEAGRDRTIYVCIGLLAALPLAGLAIYWATRADVCDDSSDDAAEVAMQKRAEEARREAQWDKYYAKMDRQQACGTETGVVVASLIC